MGTVGFPGDLGPIGPKGDRGVTGKCVQSDVWLLLKPLVLQLHRADLAGPALSSRLGLVTSWALHPAWLCEFWKIPGGRCLNLTWVVKFWLYEFDFVWGANSKIRATFAVNKKKDLLSKLILQSRHPEYLKRALKSTTPSIPSLICVSWSPPKDGAAPQRLAAVWGGTFQLPVS